jgi:hypothetical protein
MDPTLQNVIFFWLSRFLQQHETLKQKNRQVKI